MLNRVFSKTVFLSFLTLITTFYAQSQDSLDKYQSNRNLFFGITGGAMKDFGQQGNYFRGLNDFGIVQLLAIPQVASELYNKTGKNYSLAENASLMKYNVGIGVGLNVLYKLTDVNLVASGSFTKLNTSGVFTLEAENPNNPSGEKLILTETITGTERRTWIKAGIQFRNNVNVRNDLYIELAPQAIFQKAVSNTVNIEGNTYSILVNNPGNAQINTSFFGYGLNAGIGIQTLFSKSKQTQFGVNFSASKLKMVTTSKLNYAAELYLSVYL